MQQNHIDIKHNWSYNATSTQHKQLLHKTVYNIKYTICVEYSSVYSKCSKISNTIVGYKNSLDKQSTHIRLLLEKKSDQDLPCLLS